MRTPEMVRAEQIISKRLNAKHCELWPECSCYETLGKWAHDLSDEQRIWPIDLLEWAAFGWEQSTIQLAPTQYFSGKTLDSYGVIQMEPLLMEVFGDFTSRQKEVS